MPIEAASYRPSALLCTLIKVIECLLLYKIISCILFSPTQHSYRPHHSTTIFTNLVQKVQDVSSQDAIHIEHCQLQ